MHKGGGDRSQETFLKDSLGWNVELIQEEEDTHGLVKICLEDTWTEKVAVSSSMTPLFHTVRLH